MAVAEAFLEAFSSSPVSDEKFSPSPHLQRSKVAAFSHFNARQQMDFILANDKAQRYIAQASANERQHYSIASAVAESSSLGSDPVKGRLYSKTFLKQLRSMYEEPDCDKKLAAAREFARSEGFLSLLQNGVDEVISTDPILGSWRTKANNISTVKKAPKSPFAAKDDEGSYGVYQTRLWAKIVHKGDATYHLWETTNAVKKFTGKLDNDTIRWDDDDVWTRVSKDEPDISAVSRELVTQLLPHCQRVNDIDEKYQDLSVSSEKLVGTLLDMALTERAGAIFEVLELILKNDHSLVKPKSFDELTWLAREPTVSLPHKAMMLDSADVALPTLDALAFSATCDGQYFFVHCTGGLFKIGTGYHGTQLGTVYARNRAFHPKVPDVDRASMKCELVACDGKLYFRSPLLEHICVEVDKSTLEETRHLSLDDGNKGSPSSSSSSSPSSPSIHTAEDLSAYPMLKPGHSRMMAMRDHLAFLSIGRTHALVHTFSPADDFKFVARYQMRGPALKAKSSTNKKKKNAADNEDDDADPGGVYGCGGNMCGELGRGHAHRQRDTVKLPFFDDKAHLVQVSGGNQSSYFLTDTGQVYGCGNNGSAQLGLGHARITQTPELIEQRHFHDKRVVKIVAGCFTDHVMFITDDHQAYMCGANHNYTLGFGDTDNRLTPTRIEGPLKDKAIVGGAVSGQTTCWVTDTGEVWVAGSSEHLNHEQCVMEPIRLKGSENLNVVDASYGYMHALYLTDDGEVWSNGSGSQGQLGHGANTYQQKDLKRIEFFVENKIRVKKLSSGYYHCAAISEDNVLYMWGHGVSYGIPIEGHRSFNTPEAPEIFKDTPMADVSCGGFHTIFLTETNKVYSCGQNNYGEIFVEPNGPVRIPKDEVKLFEDQNVTIIYAGMYHSVVTSENCEDALSEKAYRYGHFHCGLHDLVCVAPPDMRLGYHAERLLPKPRPVRKVIPKVVDDEVEKVRQRNLQALHIAREARLAQRLQQQAKLEVSDDDKYDGLGMFEDSSDSSSSDDDGEEKKPDPENGEKVHKKAIIEDVGEANEQQEHNIGKQKNDEEEEVVKANVGLNDGNNDQNVVERDDDDGGDKAENKIDGDKRGDDGGGGDKVDEDKVDEGKDEDDGGADKNDTDTDADSDVNTVEIGDLLGDGDTDDEADEEDNADNNSEDEGKEVKDADEDVADIKAKNAAIRARTFEKLREAEEERIKKAQENVKVCVDRLYCTVLYFLMNKFGVRVCGKIGRVCGGRTRTERAWFRAE